MITNSLRKMVGEIKISVTALKWQASDSAVPALSKLMLEEDTTRGEYQCAWVWFPCLTLCLSLSFSSLASYTHLMWSFITESWLNSLGFTSKVTGQLYCLSTSSFCSNQVWITIWNEHDEYLSNELHSYNHTYC